MDYDLKLITLLDDLYKRKEFDLDVDELCSKGNIKNVLLTKAVMRKFFKNKGYLIRNNEIKIISNKDIWIKLTDSGRKTFGDFEIEYPEYFI
jgi:hypothetical protein